MYSQFWIWSLLQSFDEVALKSLSQYSKFLGFELNSSYEIQKPSVYCYSETDLG